MAPADRSVYCHTMRPAALSSVAIAALVLSLVSPLAAHADDATFAVSGHVATGDPGAVVSVSLYDADGNDVGDTEDGDVSPNGDYTITGVVPGRYTAEFSDIRDDDEDAYLPRFYGNVVTDDQTVPGVVFFDVTTANVGGVDGILDLVPFSETAAPVISGKRLFGKTLTTDTDNWAEEPDFEYQWYRGSTAITDATDDSYTITAADLGKSISVEVTASESGYLGWDKRSAGVAIPFGAGVKAAKPTITGTAAVGKTLRAVHGTWKPGKLKYTYQWFAGKKAIAKATNVKLKVTKAFAGKKISVVVSGGKVGVGAAVKKSAAVKIAR